MPVGLLDIQVDCLEAFTIFAKRPILDVWQGAEYTFDKYIIIREKVKRSKKLGWV